MGSAPKRGISDKSKYNHQRVMSLLNVEPRMLNLVRPFNLATLQPVAIQVQSPEHNLIFDYFRFCISSAPQSAALQSTGREARYIIIDKTSGAILGINALTDGSPGQQLAQWAGCKMIGNVQYGGTNTANTVIQLKRCLPLYEFGDMTGGKLLYLLTASRELMAAWEYRYSFQVMAVYVSTLHGKSSQYNRLHGRGLEYLGSIDNRGIYVQGLYENARSFIAEQTKDAGACTTYTFKEQFEYWRDRWLPNRLPLSDNGWVRPNPDNYRFSMLRKQRQLITDHDEE
jgi:hypothetical protein